MNVIDKIEVIVDNVVWFVKSLPTIIEANLSLLYHFNKNKCFFDWDYDYLYSLMAWKIERMKKRIKEDSLIVDTDKINGEMEEALKQLQIYYDPEIEVGVLDWYKEELEEAIEKEDYAGVLVKERTPEQEQELSDYYTNYHKVQQEAWDKFHDILKEHAQGWWD